MTLAAQLNAYLRLGGANGERVAAGATRFGFRIVLGMDVLFHIGQEAATPYSA
jgi:hypothetical protein